MNQKKLQELRPKDCKYHPKLFETNLTSKGLIKSCSNYCSAVKEDKKIVSTLDKINFDESKDIVIAELPDMSDCEDTPEHKKHCCLHKKSIKISLNDVLNYQLKNSQPKDRIHQNAVLNPSFLASKLTKLKAVIEDSNFQESSTPTSNISELSKAYMRSLIIETNKLHENVSLPQVSSSNDYYSKSSDKHSLYTPSGSVITIDDEKIKKKLLKSHLNSSNTSHTSNKPTTIPQVPRGTLASIIKTFKQSHKNFSHILNPMAYEHIYNQPSMENKLDFEINPVSIENIPEKPQVENDKNAQFKELFKQRLRAVSPLKPSNKENTQT